ncbi:MAG: hypothetical protein JKY37_26970, partial [Nannocystaceae bacterium]|nr:hypothetical protein [Nannocystaceae bacterium]
GGMGSLPKLLKRLKLSTRAAVEAAAKATKRFLATDTPKHARAAEKRLREILLPNGVGGPQPAYAGAGGGGGVVKGFDDVVPEHASAMTGKAGDGTKTGKVAAERAEGEVAGKVAAGKVAAAGGGEFKLAKHGDHPSPRPAGTQSHHGVMSAWMKKNYPAYKPKEAPAILMPTPAHQKTFGVYNKWRAAAKKEMGGTFDWGKVSETQMRGLSEKMFDAAGVPAQMRTNYWSWFDRMKSAL